MRTPSLQRPRMASPSVFLKPGAGPSPTAFQLYFDFSGYSDMAIGLARLFGIRLPVNFFSPYQSASIIDFWRRWHMTLSRFLRDYLYIPLGGNRSGLTRTGLNLLATMGLGGLWHGADWTFVCWGLLHGGYLILNRSWRFVRSFSALASGGWPGRLLSFCHPDLSGGDIGMGFVPCRQLCRCRSNLSRTCGEQWDDLAT